MKRVTASEARRNWFRLLDEVAAGAVVAIERNGRRILLRREDDAGRVNEPGPAYGDVLSAPCAEDADVWTWEWSPEGDLRPANEEPE